MSLEEHRAAGPRSVDVLVVTLSDSRDAAGDTSGALLRDALASAGHVVRGPRILREDPEALEAELRALLAEPGPEVVILTGGTGIAPRDLAFDILSRLYTRVIPGFGELFRALSYAEIGPAAMLSRASAGVAAGRLVLSIPGSRAAVRLALDKLILPELTHLVGELQRTRPPGGTR